MARRPGSTAEREARDRVRDRWLAGPEPLRLGAPRFSAGARRCRLVGRLPRTVPVHRGDRATTHGQSGPRVVRKLGRTRLRQRHEPHRMERPSRRRRRTPSTGPRADTTTSGERAPKRRASTRAEPDPSVRAGRTVVLPAGRTGRCGEGSAQSVGHWLAEPGSVLARRSTLVRCDGRGLLVGVCRWQHQIRRAGRRIGSYPVLGRGTRRSHRQRGLTATVRPLTSTAIKASRPPGYGPFVTSRNPGEQWLGVRRRCPCPRTERRISRSTSDIYFGHDQATDRCR